MRLLTIVLLTFISGCLYAAEPTAPPAPSKDKEKPTVPTPAPEPQKTSNTPANRAPLVPDSNGAQGSVESARQAKESAGKSATENAKPK